MGVGFERGARHEGEQAALQPRGLFVGEQPERHRSLEQMQIDQPRDRFRRHRAAGDHAAVDVRGERGRLGGARVVQARHHQRDRLACGHEHSRLLFAVDIAGADAVGDAVIVVVTVIIVVVVLFVVTVFVVTVLGPMVFAGGVGGFVARQVVGGVVVGRCEFVSRHGSWTRFVKPASGTYPGM